ncbi:MAG: hypothetical protein FWH46_00070 [Methanimicrococcus sp.]|nr:hypothetical protein [Methanimicrococcus sp.]
MSYYDDGLICYLKTIGVANFTVISKSSGIAETIERNFNFKCGRGDFSDNKNATYVKSNKANISVDAAHLLNELIHKGICKETDRVTYAGDNLTDADYEFFLYDILRILPYLFHEIPQHHYFLFEGANRLLHVSFENELQFGML